MAAETQCPKCGLILAPNAPRGLCPGCLFQGALDMPLSGTGVDPWPESADFTPPTPEELAPLFPDLELVELVGRGGMGLVYKARQPQLDRMVALKILLPSIARDPAFAERFAREARMMALLNHPNVVAVYDFGQTSPLRVPIDGAVTGDLSVASPLYYFLMEFVDGLTLRQLLDAGQLQPQEAFAVVPQICEALQFAHDKGIVHRDIKPENILLNRKGQVKIADFGLAKLMGLQPNDVTISRTGQVLGTLHYMAPEQVEHPLEVDHRADIYSLGVVFYQMLTGELPLGRFAPPSSKIQVDVRLDEIVLRALEKEPDRRYQQASAFKTQVESLTRGASDHALQPAITRLATISRGHRLGRMLRQNRITSWFFRMGFVGLVLSCLGWMALVRIRAVTRPSTGVDLATRPDLLSHATTSQAIQAGVEDPMTAWPWIELERRSLTSMDADLIMNGLTNWMHREHPEGMTEPMHNVGHFLRKIDDLSLVSESQALKFLVATYGELRASPRSGRLRQGTHSCRQMFEWSYLWDRNLFAMELLNELASTTIDGELIPSGRMFGTNWDTNDLWVEFDPSRLMPGEHRLKIEVLSAIVATRDLVGLKKDAPSFDWPPAIKRWTRSAEVKLIVYATDAVIIGQTEDPKFDPVAHGGMKIEPILIRTHGEKPEAVVSFKFDQNLPVSISFDVTLRIDGHSISCGKLWQVALPARQGRSSTVSYQPVTVNLEPLGVNVREAEVVLTPNPKWAELNPAVDRIWGREVRFSNVPLRRLDTTTPLPH